MNKIKEQLKSQYNSIFFASILLSFLFFTAVNSQAAITLVGSNTRGGNLSSLSITKPAGTTTNDVMLAQISIIGNSGVAINAPAGWTLINRRTNGTTISQAIYYKVATAAEPASYAWTFSKRRCAGGIISYRGVDVSASPIDVSGGQTNASSIFVVAPTVTTTVNNARLVGFFGTAASTTFSGVPAGMTQRCSVNSGGAGVAIMAADETWAAAGPTGTRTATASAAAVNIGHLVALKPSTNVLDHFHVEIAGGGAIPNQTAGISFNIRITAHTPAEAVYTGFSGTVDLTTTGTFFSGGGATAAFVNGVLASHTLSMASPGTGFTITATNSSGSETGTSNTFDVVSGGPTQLQILAPGETSAPGTPTGKTGTPDAQSQGIPFTITVNAVDNAWNIVGSSETIAISSSDGAATLPPDAALVLGTNSFNVTLNTVGSFTVTASDTTGPLGSDTSPSITVNAVSRRFETFETSTAGGSTVGQIKTKIAGSSFSLDVQALLNNGAIQGGYNNAITVELLDSSDNSGATDSRGCKSSWTNISTFSLNPAWSSGRTTISLSENNSYPDARIKVTKTGTPTQNGCSSNNFAIRPDSFSSISIQDANWQTAGAARNLNNSSASGGTVHKAGRPFRITATAINSAAATTTNYAGSLTANITAYIQPAGGTAGTMTIGAGAISGVMTSTTATYDDVGSFTMQLEDQTFADVDTSDSSTAERYISSSAFNVGRFVPDYFDVAAGNTPQFATFNNTGCGSRSFTYIGQPFGYAVLPRSLVTARNAGGNTTANYTGSLQKIAAADVTQTYTNANAGSTPTLDTSSIGSPTFTDNGDGTVIVTQAAAGTLVFTQVAEASLSGTDIPFNANISLAVSVVDSSEADGNISSSTNAAFNGSGSGIAFDSGTEFRYGHLALANAFGPETEPLEMKSLAQYYDSSQEWSANTADNCTSLVYAGKTESDITVTELIAAGTTLTLSSGQVSFTLTPATDSGDPGGTITINYSSLPAWLDHPLGTGSAEAKFGIYRGNDRIINWQEILR